MATNTNTNPHTLNGGMDLSLYRHVGEFYRGQSSEVADAFSGEHRLLQDMGVDFEYNVSFHANGGCAHCGAYFSYGSVFSHPEHGFVALGHACTQRWLEVDSSIALRQAKAKKRGQAAAKQAKIAAEFQATVDADPELADAANVEHYIITDIMNKGRRYGSISEKQRALVIKIATEAREAEAAKADEPPAAEVPDTDERITVRGKVLNTKWVYSQFGSTEKMLVEVTTDAGVYRLWGTIPSAIAEADRGDMVEFTATITRSHDDGSFGFFKRPTKPAILEPAAA